MGGATFSIPLAHMEPVKRDATLADSYDLLVYTDGASRNNPGNAAIGYAMFAPDGAELEKGAKFVGTRTNNEAEYEALIWALDRAAAVTKGKVKFHSDSELMVLQVNGVYEVKNERMRAHYVQVKERTKGFKSFKLVHLPRDNPRIQLVDGLVNEALDRVRG